MGTLLTSEFDSSSNVVDWDSQVGTHPSFGPSPEVALGVADLPVSVSAVRQTYLLCWDAFFTDDSIMASPGFRLVALLALQLLGSIGPLIAVPFSGSFYGVLSPKSASVSFTLFLSFWLPFDGLFTQSLSTLYFFFTMPRWPMWVHGLASLTGIACCVGFCFWLGPERLPQSGAKFNLYSHQFFIGLAIIVHMIGAWHYAAWRRFAFSLLNHVFILSTLVFAQLMFTFVPNQDLASTSTSTGTSKWTLVAVLMGFNLGCALFRTLNNVAGRQVSSHNGFSVRALYMFVQHALYFCFYRTLFLHLEETSDLAIVLSCQVLQELFLYGAMLFPSVYHIQRTLRLVAKRVCCSLLPGVPLESYEEWHTNWQDSDAFTRDYWIHVDEASCCYVTRMLAMTTTGATFIVLYACVYNAPYVAQHFPRLTNGVDGALLVKHTLVSLALELIVALGMNACYKQYLRRGTWMIWSRLSRHRAQWWLFVLLGTHLIVDVYTTSLQLTFG